MMWTLIALHIGTMAGCALGTLLIGHLITQRRPPLGNLAWVLAIVLVPYVGLPLYLFLGGRKMRRLASRKHPIVLPEPEPEPDVAARLSPHEVLLLDRRIPPARGGNRLVLHTTGEAHYAALVDLIDGAEHSLSVCMYILQPDAVGRDVLARLAHRAEEGLRVRVLLDGVGSLHTRRRVLAPLARAGGRYAYFMPVFRRPLRGRANLRNHRKAVIADERIVLAGGANIGAEYMGPRQLAGPRQQEHEPGPERWTDLTFTLEGPAVRQYAEVFRSDWGFASGEWLRSPAAPEPAGSHAAEAKLASRAASTGHAGSARIQVVPSGPDVPGDPLSDALLTLAQSARERLWIVTPYFIPDDAFCRTLALTAHRGVDVRVIVPASTDHFLVEIAARSYLREIGRAGGKILAYPRMLHAKAVLVDEELAVLGSANIDMRSLMLNYEIAVLVSSAAELRAVAHWMEALQREAHPRVLKSGGAAELGEGLARLIAPQL